MTPPGFEPPPPPLAPGTLVDGRWRVRAVLGEGATGVVYDVGDEHDATETAGAERVDVALKLVHPHLAGDPQIRGRLAREVIALRKVHHPNVCPVLDWGEMARAPEAGPPVPYVVLRRIRGPSLEDLLLERGTLPLGRALDILEEIAQGVSAAHAVGVVHRDLKPSNVMLEGGRRAVVVDFGLSRVLGGGTGTTGLTEHDMLVGTPEYMSPEQARGDEPDARTDVYALGVLAYELATGCVPFAASSPFVVLTAQLEEAPVAPRVRAPARGIGEGLEGVILKALAKAPGDRFPTVSAFLEALAAVRSPEALGELGAEGAPEPEGARSAEGAGNAGEAEGAGTAAREGQAQAPERAPETVRALAPSPAADTPRSQPATGPGGTPRSQPAAGPAGTPRSQPAAMPAGTSRSQPRGWAAGADGAIGADGATATQISAGGSARSVRPSARPAPPPSSWPSGSASRAGREAANAKRRSVVLWIAVALISLAVGMWLGLADLPPLARPARLARPDPLAPSASPTDAAAHDQDR